MPLYQNALFTIDLTKIIAVYQNEDDPAVNIRTDDQRKIEVATDNSQAAMDLLNEIAGQWESAVGPLLRHGKHVFLTAAIYSIQVQEAEVYINFRDHSVSFAAADADQALELLAQLSRAWQAATTQA
jgi:hypothetical protein